MNNQNRVLKSRLERRASRNFKMTGKMHFRCNVLFALTVTLLSWTMIHNYSIWMVLLLPAAFIAGTLVEYCGHRWLLHIYRPFFKTPYQEHTLSHHFYFTHEALELNEDVDYHFVLFNLTGLIFFVLVVGGCISLGVSFLLGRDFGLFFMGLCGLYFFIYEIFHTIYHLPEQHFIFDLNLFRRLREHHKIHHDQSVMNNRNFGIISDLWDRVLKTKI